MAYVKTEWATGDIISAEKLNHAEDGIQAANKTGEVIFNTTDQVLEASFNELMTMLDSGIVPWIRYEATYGETVYNQICRMQFYFEETPEGGELTYAANFYSNNSAAGPLWLSFFNTDPDENMLAD